MRLDLLVVAVESGAGAVVFDGPFEGTLANNDAADDDDDDAAEDLEDGDEAELAVFERALNARPWRWPPVRAFPFPVFATSTFCFLDCPTVDASSTDRALKSTEPA